MKPEKNGHYSEQKGHQLRGAWNRAAKQAPGIARGQLIIDQVRFLESRRRMRRVSRDGK